MNESKKAWVIVYRLNGSTPELLLLKPNPEPGLVYDYYVITGGIEKGETPDQAALRETQEEIGVKPLNIFNLNETFEYEDKLTNHKIVEYCFAVEINNSNIELNEEHIGYKWVLIGDFKKMIWWEGSKVKLNKIINTLVDSLSSRNI
ncbi:MAG TPA: NUDIX domain-containing protein [Candidatus Dormibacteraeota bacterium]|nr:NUDIX domain-containing protein [Candidatus Dormibacteraeota bacterium]